MSIKLALSVCLLLGFFPLSSAGSPHWKILNPYPVAGEVTSIDFPGEDTVWAASDGGLLLRSDDAGESWKEIALPRSTRRTLLVDFITGSAGFVVAVNDPTNPYGAVMFSTVNAGAFWSETSIGDQGELFGASVISAAGNTLLIGGSALAENRAAVYRWVDGQLTRSLLPNEAVTGVKGLSLFNNSIGWAVNLRGYFASTTDGGRTWTEAESGVQTDLYAVAPVSPIVGWIGGGSLNQGELLKTTDGGTNWQVVEDLDLPNRIAVIRPYMGSGAVILTRGGGDQNQAALLISSNGRNWSDAGSVNNELMTSLAVRGDKVVAGGKNGMIVRKIGGNDLETISRRATTRTLWDISFSSLQAGWAVGESGTVIRTDNGGESWMSIERFPGEPSAVLSLGFESAFVACRGSNELRTDNGGASWSSVDVSPADVIGFESNGGTVYAFGGEIVSVSSDNGENWTSSTIIEGATITSIGVATDDIAYAGLRNEPTMVTMNGGRSWDQAPRLPSNCQVIRFLDADISWAAEGTEAGSEIWKTYDGWQSRQSLSVIRSDLADLAPVGLEAGFAVTTSGEVVVIGNVQSGVLKSVNPVRKYCIFNDYIWTCGDGGQIARWGEQNLSVGSDWATEIPTAIGLIEVWPNPSNGWVNISFNQGMPGKALFLIDIQGRVITELNSQPHARQMSLFLAAVPSGTYLLRDNEGLFGSKPILLLK